MQYWCVSVKYQEALSNVVENALKFCKMGRGEGGKDGGDRATVILRARSSTAEESWGADRWALRREQAVYDSYVFIEAGRRRLPFCCCLMFLHPPPPPGRPVLRQLESMATVEDIRGHPFLKGTNLPRFLSRVGCT